jgi:REP element-mobilizing transposase RayT
LSGAAGNRPGIYAGSDGGNQTSSLNDLRPFTGVFGSPALAPLPRRARDIMSRNYYSEIHLHLTWHTKDSLPLLVESIEPLAHACIKRRIISTEGSFVHEIGGTETHVHVAVTIPPTLTISEFVGQLKGATSYEVNHHGGTREAILQWQSGYGVVSFGSKDLEWIKQYIRNQREHHTNGQIHSRLERVTDPDA